MAGTSFLSCIAHGFGLCDLLLQRTHLSVLVSVLVSLSDEMAGSAIFPHS